MVSAAVYNARQDYDVVGADNVLSIHWRASMPLVAVDDLRAELQSLRLAHPEGVALFTIVDPGVATPEPAARSAVAQFLRGGDGIIRASALIFPGNNLRAKWARAIATTIILASRTGYPSKCFAAPSDGLQWLSEHVLLAESTSAYVSERSAAYIRAA